MASSTPPIRGTRADLAVYDRAVNLGVIAWFKRFAVELIERLTICTRLSGPRRRRRKQLGPHHPTNPCGDEVQVIAASEPDRDWLLSAWTRAAVRMLEFRSDTPPPATTSRSDGHHITLSRSAAPDGFRIAT